MRIYRIFYWSHVYVKNELGRENKLAIFGEGENIRSILENIPRSTPEGTLGIAHIFKNISYIFLLPKITSTVRLPKLEFCKNCCTCHWQAVEVIEDLTSQRHSADIELWRWLFRSLVSLVVQENDLEQFMPTVKNPL